MLIRITKDFQGGSYDGRVIVAYKKDSDHELPEPFAKDLIRQGLAEAYAMVAVPEPKPIDTGRTFEETIEEAEEAPAWPADAESIETKTTYAPPPLPTKRKSRKKTN